MNDTFINPTSLQHQGKDHRVGKGLVSAVEMSVTFQTTSTEDPPVYSRLGNTSNHYEVEELLADLHGAEDAIVTGSGMSSFTLLFQTFLKPGDHVLVQECCYGGTYNILTKVYGQWGIEITFAAIETWKDHVKPNTKMALFESISNPFCKPQDIVLAVSVCKKKNIISVCDNTFASPALCKPLIHGVDIVLESATKYLNGHSDVIAGMLAGRKELMTSLRTKHAYLGTFLPPYFCSQLLRGLRTLHVRMNYHTLSGSEFARILQKETELVQKVYYGTENPQIKSIFPHGFGGMVTVQFAKTVNVKHMMRAMHLVADVPSLGGTESTATMPAFTTNWFMSQEEKARFEIDESLVRFSIGLEKASDIATDVIKACR